MAVARKKKKSEFDLGEWFVEGLEWWANELKDDARQSNTRRNARLLRRRALQLRHEALIPRTVITLIRPTALIQEAQELEALAEELEEQIA